jgi:hypothetical protein
MRAITAGKKKNVVFEDEFMMKEEQSEVDIPNDDETQDNEYN